MTYSDEYFMNQAYREALKADQEDEVPIGAVIVCQNRIIARAHNLTERLNDVTAHAEMQAFTAAADFLGGKYLDECTLYVTLEPCIMCAGAAFWTQISRIVFAAPDPKRGYSNFIIPDSKFPILHPKTSISSGIMEYECSNIISAFFKKKRS
jgi:tRNA(adenine34) deaminase